MTADAPDTIDVLLVEDNPGDARLVEKHLADASGSTLARPSATHVESLTAALDHLRTGAFDVVLLDLGLPGSSGIETLDSLQEAVAADESLSPVPVVVLTGLSDRQTAVEAIQRGAQDYLVKGNLDGYTLERAVRYALERHEQEQKLKRQNERLDQFASVVSHDLRNPLNIAMGQLEVAEETGDPAAFGSVSDALGRMGELIDDLLLLAREGRSVDDPVPIDLASAARQCWSTVDTAEMELVVDADATVLADDSRLQQLLENLYRNAREHAGESVTVRVGLLDDGDGFYVADDGPGIPEADRDSVFEPGFSTRDDGTGFGLNIVSEVAQAHGWDAAVTDADRFGADPASDASPGTRFEIRGVDLL